MRQKKLRVHIYQNKQTQQRKHMKLHETQTLIAAHPQIRREQVNGMDIHVAEMFGDTVQGEGIHTGVPALFLRVQGCTLGCTWCDSQAVWREGNPYTAEEILQIWETNGFVEKLKMGHHLVLTGGSPMKQQIQLVNLIQKFIQIFGFKPFIEVENECTLMPSSKMIGFVDTWNNSPKLSMSGNGSKRYNTKVLKTLGEMRNSWFKFVVAQESDWDEIFEKYIEAGLITRDRIILMPCGATQEELVETPHIAIALAVKHGVQYSDRLHIRIWNEKTGV